MRFLTGEYFHKLDAKNRIRIPAKLKKELGDSYYFTKGTNGCLFVFSQEAIEATLESIMQDIKISDDQKQKGLRAFTKSLVAAEEDNQGRIVLNSALKKFAGIKDEIVFCGSGNRIDIWSKDKYEEYFSGSDESFDDLLKALDI